MKKSVVLLVMCLLLTACFSTIPVRAEESVTEPMAYFNFDGEDPFEGGNEYEIMPYMDGNDIDYDSLTVDVVEGMQGFGKAAQLCMPESPENSVFLKMSDGLLKDIAGDDFTISFWFQGKDGLSATTPLALGYTSLNPFFLFEINDVKEVCLVYFDAAGVIQRAVGAGSGVDVTQGWHMYTLVVTRGDTSDTLNYYIDGNLIVSKNDTKLPAYGESENENVFNHVGKSFWGQPTASGLIDEIRFYDVALTADEIEAIKTISNNDEAGDDNIGGDNTGGEGSESGDEGDEGEQPGNIEGDQEETDKEDVPVTGDGAVVGLITTLLFSAYGINRLKRKK